MPLPPPGYRHLLDLDGTAVYLLPTGSLGLVRHDGEPVTDAQTHQVRTHLEAHPELFDRRASVAA